MEAHNKPKNSMHCKSSAHHFSDLACSTHGAECRCKKRGLVVRFNRGWPERIVPEELEAFLAQYRGSVIDFMKEGR